MPTYTNTAGSVKNVARASSVGVWSNAGAVWNGASQGAYYQFTDYLCFYNFGFSIPSTESIVGIQVQYPIYNSPDTNEKACDSSVVLTADALTQIVGSVDHATATPYSNISLTTQYHGTSADTWSASLTYAQANSSNFGFMLSCKETTGGVSGPTSQVASATPTIVITTVVNPTLVPNASTMYQAGIMPVNGSRIF